MRKTTHSGGFFICLLFNMIINLQWAIPAAVCLIMHFIWDISLWWFVGALALWVLIMVVWMLIIGWASNCGDTPTPERENLNPYSQKNMNPYSAGKENHK